MSSRALRRLQREKDAELFSVLQSQQAKTDDCCDGTSDEETPDTADFIDNRDSVNHGKFTQPTNLFDLVLTVSCMWLSCLMWLFCIFIVLRVDWVKP